jgi:hypothetical protein
MNKNFTIALAVVVALIVLGLFFVRTYTSSPGFVTEEAAQEFYASAPTCYGVSLLLNREAMAADAPGKSLCIGILK